MPPSVMCHQKEKAQSLTSLSRVSVSFNSWVRMMFYETNLKFQKAMTSVKSEVKRQTAWSWEQKPERENLMMPLVECSKTIDEKTTQS